MTTTIQEDTYTASLKQLWDRAVERYQNDERDPSAFFNAAETAILDSIGTTPQELFDFVEDWVQGGEPDFLTFALVTDMRRNYFLLRQNGRRSDKLVGPDDLPPKDASVRGIEWLPRILAKAKAKLRGEMNPDLMYGCGGDRKFFRENGILPSTFLQLVALNEANDEAVIDWVANHSGSANPAQ